MGKGAETRERILDTAFRMAARDGLDGLSLGQLAAALGLSKSGLFAHFDSKQLLQIDLLRTAAEKFTAAVLLPAFRKPRGLPRLRAVFDGWLRWVADPSMPGGCLLHAAATELDDREGPVRDYLVATLRELNAAIAKAARLAVEEGHFRRGVDCEQFAFEMQAVLLAYNQHRRLFRDARSERRAREAFERLIRSSSVQH